MDPLNKHAADFEASIGLSATGLPVPFAGLSNRAEYSQIVGSLDKMSISKGACSGGSGSSTNIVAGVHLVAKDTLGAKELALYPEQCDAVANSDSRGNPCYDESIKGSVQVFHIPPRMIFFGALNSVGIVNPAIIDIGFQGAHQVHIQLVCNLPLCLKGGSKFVDITGDVCVSYELAECSAIKKTFDHLYKWHNVVLVDISYRKKQDHSHNSRVMYCNVMDALRIVGNMIQHWLECLDKLYQVEKFALSPRQVGSPVVSRIITDVHSFLVSIKDGAMEKIRSCDARLKRLDASKDEWTQRSNSTAFYRKASIVKAYHYEQDVLSLLVRWLRLEECQFWAGPVDGGRFLGAVMISYPESQNVVPSGDTCVEANREESTEELAKNRAARIAIYRLEDEFSVEIVGLNHSEAVLAGHDSAMISGLNIELKLLGASVLKDIGDMVNMLNESVSATKNALALIPPVLGFDGGVAFATKLSAQFDVAAAECNELLKRDAAKYNSLN